MLTSRLRSFLFVTGALLAVAIAQAQQVSQPSKSPAAAAAQAAQAEAAKKAADQLVRDARGAGFKPEHIGGVLMFCRTATELGSNFPVRTCYNGDQVKIKIEEYRAQRNQLEAEHSIGMQIH